MSLLASRFQWLRERAHFDSLYSGTETAEYLRHLADLENRNFWEMEEVIRREVPEARRGRILELGCGSGILTKVLAPGAAFYAAIDVSRAGFSWGSWAGDCHFLQMAAEKLAFRPVVFDLVTGVGILHHVNLRNCIANVARVLKPGGFFLFFDPNRLFPENLILNNVDFVRAWSTMSPDEEHFSKATLEKRLRLAGGFEVRVRNMYICHPKLPTALQPVERILLELAEAVSWQFASRVLYAVGRKTTKSETSLAQPGGQDQGR